MNEFTLTVIDIDCYGTCACSAPFGDYIRLSSNEFPYPPSVGEKFLWRTWCEGEPGARKVWHKIEATTTPAAGRGE